MLSIIFNDNNGILAPRSNRCQSFHKWNTASAFLQK